MQIRAVKSEPATWTLQAALEDKEVKSCRAMIVRAGIYLTGKISHEELGTKLARSELTIAQRIQIKAALFRNNLVA